MASEILQEISRDEDERALYLSRKKYEMDMYSNFKAAERVGQMLSDAKWQGVVAEKDAVIADNQAKLADNEAIIESLRLQIAQLQEK